MQMQLWTVFSITCFYLILCSWPTL